MGQSEACATVNLRAAKSIWSNQLTRSLRALLSALTIQFGLSVTHGDVLLLDRSWYVTHTGLLRLARRNRCAGIDVRPVTKFCDPSASRWAFKATVYTSRTCRGFVGFGDADPSNVSARVRGAEMRVAETRAVNRALRKAFGIGICSVEELGSFSGPLEPAPALKKPVQSESSNDKRNGNGHRLRDRLCLLIRQHQLDAALVKLYAADFCSTKELRDASREQVAEFVNHLAEYAANDRDGLLCQLNSYAPKPVSSAEGVVDAEGEQKAAGAA
jgi:hypothetical protein